MRQGKYLDFPTGEYMERYNRLREEMAGHDIDALFLTDRANVEYFTGFDSVSWRLKDKAWYAFLLRDSIDRTVLIVDQVHQGNAEARTWVEDVRFWGVGKNHLEVTRQAISDLGLEKATVGMELGDGQRVWATVLDFDSIRKTLSKAKLVDASDLLFRTKAIKSKNEIERLRKAGEITCKGLRNGFETFKREMSERDLSNAIVTCMLKEGADSSYYNTCGGILSVRADRESQMTPIPIDRKIEKGEVIRVDGGAVFKGYFSDIIRMAIVGESPNPTYQRTYDVLLKAFDAALEVVKPGATPAEIWSSYMRVIRDQGYEHLMPQWTSTMGINFGHGIGFEIHEMPFLTSTGKQRLEESMVIAFEQGLRVSPNSFLSLDFEDNFVITKKGHELISPLERKIWTLSY